MTCRVPQAPLGAILAGQHRALLPVKTSQVDRYGFQITELCLLQEEEPPLAIAHVASPIRFLCTSRDGDHYAYWAQDSESFRLGRLSSGQVVARVIHTEHAMEHGIVFAPDGEVVALEDDYDGVYRIHLSAVPPRQTLANAGDEEELELDDEDQVEFESAKGVLYDSGLTLFAVPANERREATATLHDRTGRVCGQLAGSLPTSFDAIALEASAKEVWLAKDGGLSSYGFNGQPRARLSLPNLPGEQIFSLSLSKSFVLVHLTEHREAEPQRGRRAVMVSRDDGRLLWEHRNLDRVTVIGSRVLAEHSDGRVALVHATGRTEFTAAPEPGWLTIGAAVGHGTLTVGFLEPDSMRVAFIDRLINGAEE